MMLTFGVTVWVEALEMSWVIISITLNFSFSWPAASQAQHVVYAAFAAQAARTLPAQE